MANRPVFVSVDQFPYYKQVNVEFDYFSGFALSQKQKSITSLHESARRINSDIYPIEISSKGAELLGIELSAFNLKFKRNGKEYPIESIFQGSKVFENGGPYIDLYEKGPKEAKKDERIRNSGKIIDFRLDGCSFSTEPRDFFYNWIYSSALFAHNEYWEKLMDYNAFTDIEFNPEKSVNCQARTVAIVRGLLGAGKFEETMKSPQDYLNIVYEMNNISIGKQMSLFDFL